MKDTLYVMLLERTKIYNRMNKEAVIKHVDNIRDLDNNGNLKLCGVLKGLKGFAGMIILNAASYEEAEELCQKEPLVIDGYATYKLLTLKVGNKENNYLL